MIVTILKFYIFTSMFRLGEQNVRRNIDNKFPLKVWTLTILTAPLLLFVVLGLYSARSLTEFSGVFVLFILTMFYGVAFSLPSFFLFKLLHKEIKHNSIGTRWKKLVLALVGICLVWLTFYFLDRNFFVNARFDDYMLPSAYSLTLFVSTLLLPMNNKKVEKQDNIKTNNFE